MTAAVPGVIAWPVLTFMAIVLAARFWWCRTNLYETYFTNLMALLLLAQLLRDPNAEKVLSGSALITVTTAQQLGFAAMIFAATEMIGFTTLWTRCSPVEARRSHRYYRLAAVILCVAYLVAAARARIAGQTLEVSGGWDAILAWTCYLTMIVVLGARIIWMFASELPKSTRNREIWLAAIGGLILGIVVLTVSMEALVLAVTEQLGWTYTIGFRLWFHGFLFFYVAFSVYLLGAVPLAVRLRAYLGLDPISRNWKRLQPLLLSMTTVVPESSFDLEHNDNRSRKTTLQLHQAVIAIRDAILRLRPYFRDMSPHELAQFLSAYSVPTREHDAATRALQLAHAARAKAAGATPSPTDMDLVVRSRSTTLDEDAAELLKLARWWKPAYAATEELTLTTPDVKASSPA
jgi:hypothetical protein